MRFREPVNGFSHLVGVLLAFAGLLWLIWISIPDIGQTFSVTIYGLSLIMLFAASTAYHLWNGSTRSIQRLRRLDHAAIYLVIAGSYTPICYNALTGDWRWWMLGAIWLMAIAGIIYKLLFLNNPGIYSLLYYVLMGCLSLAALPELIRQLPQSAAQLMLMGGISFLIGAIIFGAQKPNLHHLFGHHELWHVMVLLGCGFHFFAVIRCLI